MSTINVVLDRADAEQLAKRIKNPYEVRVGRERAFQNLLIALETALKIDTEVQKDADPRQT